MIRPTADYTGQTPLPVGGVWPGRQVDDLGFLDQVLDEVQADYAVDADRIYMMGHSNGGMLTHQYACDRPGWSGAMSTPTASDFWRGRNGCAADPAVTEVPDRNGGDGSTVRVHDYDGPAGTDVVVHEAIGGGHQWFGAGDILPSALLGNNNHDQVANEVFWDFFSRFRL